MSQITNTFERLSELPFINVTDQNEIRILTKKETSSNYKPKKYDIDSTQSFYTESIFQTLVNEVIDNIKSRSRVVNGLNMSSDAASIVNNVETAAKICSINENFGTVPVAIMSIETYKTLRTNLVGQSQDKIYIGGILTNLPFYPIVDRKVSNEITVFLSPIKGKSNSVVMPMPIIKYTEIGEGENIFVESGILIPDEFNAVTIVE